MQPNSLSRRVIIKEYQVIRESGIPLEHPIIREIALRLGYKLDENNSNAYIRKVVSQHIESIQKKDNRPSSLHVMLKFAA